MRQVKVLKIVREIAELDLKVDGNPKYFVRKSGTENVKNTIVIYEDLSSNTQYTCIVQTQDELEAYKKFCDWADEQSYEVIRDEAENSGDVQ